MSGLSRTPGKRVQGNTLTGVRIPPSPPEIKSPADAGLFALWRDFVRILDIVILMSPALVRLRGLSVFDPVFCPPCMAGFFFHSSDSHCSCPWQASASCC